MSGIKIRYFLNGKLYGKEEWASTLEDIEFLENLPCKHNKRSISVFFGKLASGHEGSKREWTLYELHDSDDSIGISNKKNDSKKPSISKEFRVQERKLVEFSYDDFLTDSLKN